MEKVVMYGVTCTTDAVADAPSTAAAEVKTRQIGPKTSRIPMLFRCCVGRHRRRPPELRFLSSSSYYSGGEGLWWMFAVS